MPRKNGAVRHASDTPLKGARKAVDRVLFLSELNLILTSCDDGVVRIYDRDTIQGDVLRVFDKHVGAWFEGPIQLHMDVVASVDREGRLYVWNPSTAEVFGMINLKEYGEPTALCKLSDLSIIVGTKKGVVLVVTHSVGHPMTVSKVVHDMQKMEVSDIAMYGNRVFVCSTDWTVKVLNCISLSVVETIRHFGPVFHVTINAKYLASISRGKVDKQVFVRINVFENKPGYKEVYRFSMPDVSWGGAVLLDEDVVAIPCDKYLNFLSLSEEGFIERIPRGRGGLLSAAVFNDGRIAITGNRGFSAIIATPDIPRLRYAVGECTRRLYGMSAFGADEEPVSNFGGTDTRASPRRRKRPKWMHDEDLTGGRVHLKIEEEVLDSGDAENLFLPHSASTALTTQKMPPHAIQQGDAQIGIGASEYRTRGCALQPLPVRHGDHLGIDGGDGGAPLPFGMPVQQEVINQPQAQPNPLLQPGPVQPQLAVPTASSVSTDAESEIHEWKMRKVSKNVFVVLETEQVAAALSAFLVNYERTRALQFAQFKHVLAQLFHKRFVYGWSFVNFSEEEKKHLDEMTTNALAQVTEADSMVYLQMGLKHFLQIVGEG